MGMVYDALFIILHDIKNMNFYEKKKTILSLYRNLPNN